MRHEIIVLTSLLLAGTSVDSLAQRQSRECSVTVEMPQNRARVTEPAGDVAGTATLPPEGHLWVLARRQGLAEWWPQGGGPAPVDEGRWTVYATYGSSGELGNFEIAVVVVGTQADQSLRAWVQNARPPYPPTQFPNTLPQCPVRMLVIQKVSG